LLKTCAGVESIVVQISDTNIIGWIC